MAPLAVCPRAAPCVARALTVTPAGGSWAGGGTATQFLCTTVTDGESVCSPDGITAISKPLNAPDLMQWLIDTSWGLNLR